MIQNESIENITKKEPLILIKYALPTAKKHNITRLHSYSSVLGAITSGLGYGFLPTNLLDETETSSITCMDKHITYKIISENSYFVFNKNTPKIDTISMLISYFPDSNSKCDKYLVLG